MHIVLTKDGHSIGDFSAMGHLIHIMFISTVGFVGPAYCVLLLKLLVTLNPRGSCRPSWKISSEYVPGMGYPIHFHEGSFAGIWATIMYEQ